MQNRRVFLKQIAVGTTAFTCLGLPALQATPKKKLNFVFFLVDDLGWADVGCYGNKFNETPNIDKLASQGMRFTDAYAACPVCSPTRASIMSGQYPAHIGITDFIPGHWRPYEKLTVPINRTQYLPLETVTIAESLKTQGYVSGAFGKWHLGGMTYFPDKQGFDTMGVQHGGAHFGTNLHPIRKLAKDEYLAEALSELGEKFIEDNKDKPFFLYLSHYAVHIPLQAKKDLIAKYEKKTKPKEGVNNPIYAAMVEHVDHSVGRIMKKIDDLKLANDTVFIFFSDNGGLRQMYTKEGPIVTSNAPLRDEKGTVYEGGIREPLIIRWPGKVKPGTTCDVPVTSVDFYPTLLELSGAKKPEKQDLDGESILPLLEESGKLERKAIYWHYPVYHHSSPAGVIRRGNWKLIEFFEDGRLELYNLKDDIGETKNLAKTMPQRAKRMQGQLADWRTSINAAMPTPNPDFDPKRREEWGKHPGR